MNNNLPTISVVIATWNSEKYIVRLLKSIAEQSYAILQVIVVDNASSDNTVKMIRENFSGTIIIENRRNLGFSKPYNQGIKMSKSDYVLVCNHDIVLDKDFLSILAEEAAKNPGLASLGGKLMKFRLDDAEVSGIKYLDYIDSAGLSTTRSREFFDRGQDQIDDGKYDNQQEVFGISGALVLYKRTALEEINTDGEYFDEDFFAYKEDADLAWRLKLAGHTALYQPKALAWHARTLSQEKKTNRVLSLKKIFLQLRRDKFLNFLSYRNQLFMLTKNKFYRSFFKDSIFISFTYLRNIVFYLFFQPKVFFKVWREYFKLRPKMRQKRKNIQKITKVDKKQACSWFRKKSLENNG